MNALRLSSTTTNMAYRAADYERWNGQDFVLGIEIRRSDSNRGPVSYTHLSQKEEIANERHEIFSGASCPDLSFDNLIGIGDLSGVAREFMTIDAKIKATEQMEIFGPVVQRCVAIVQAGMARISHIKNAGAIEGNYFEVKFGSILPKNLTEILQNLAIANGNKPINSQETITAESPYTKRCV